MHPTFDHLDTIILLEIDSSASQFQWGDFADSSPWMNQDVGDYHWGVMLCDDTIIQLR